MDVAFYSEVCAMECFTPLLAQRLRRRIVEILLKNLTSEGALLRQVLRDALLDTNVPLAPLAPEKEALLERLSTPAPGAMFVRWDNVTSKGRRSRELYQGFAHLAGDQLAPAWHWTLLGTRTPGDPRVLFLETLLPDPLPHKRSKVVLESPTSHARRRLTSFLENLPKEHGRDTNRITALATPAVQGVVSLLDQHTGELPEPSDTLELLLETCMDQSWSPGLGVDLFLPLALDAQLTPEQLEVARCLFGDGVPAQQAVLVGQGLAPA